jgi:hypothetical protein
VAGGGSVGSGCHRGSWGSSGGASRCGGGGRRVAGVVARIVARRVAGVVARGRATRGGDVLGGV